MKLSLRSSLLLAFSVINLLATGFFTAQNYYTEKKAFLAGVDDLLVSATAAVPHILADDFHDRAVAPGVIAEAEHVSNREGLNRFANRTGIYYLYTYVVTANNEVYATSTNERPDADPEIYSDYWELYEEPPAEMLEALRQGKDIFLEYSDEWGSFRSHFQSARSPSGQPYLIGSDLEIQFIEEHLQETLKQSLGIGALLFVLILMVSSFISLVLASEIRRLTDETETIGRFQLEKNSIPKRSLSTTELEQLAGAVESMKTNLRSFRKFVPEDLVRQLVASGQEAGLGGKQERLTVFFADLAGFTSLAEQISTDELVRYLERYFSVMSHEILSQQGTLDKFIGDAVMAFWGAPTANEHHAELACRAAIRCQQSMNELRKELKAEGAPDLHVRIGINTGDLIVGNIGTEKRLDYTVLGDTVNVAARLEGLNKIYETALLISADTWEVVQDKVLARPLDRVALRGKKSSALVYELVAMLDEATPDQYELVHRYQEALHAYSDAEWDRCLQLCEAVFEIAPDDGPTTTISKRCNRFKIAPPDKWDGVFYSGRRITDVNQFTR